MSKTKTNEQWLQEASQFPYSTEYEWLDEYRGVHTKIRYRHSVCGEVREITPNNFFKGQQCKCQANEKRKQTNLERYSVENPTQLKKMQEKIKQTNIDRYGVENPMQSEEIKAKAKKTNLERYGTENVFQSSVIKEKIKQTNLNRYDVEHPMYSKEIKEKVKETNVKRYGVSTPLQSNNIKEKIKQDNIEKYGVQFHFQSNNVKEKIKQTNLNRYGTENPMQSEKIKVKVKQTNLIRYGTENFNQRNRTSEQIAITDSKEKLEQFILENRDTKTNKQMAEMLGFIDIISYWRYIDKHNLRTIVPDCSFSSTGENEIAEFIQELGFDIERHNRTILSDNREIDIFIPEKKLGIEYNGLHWHSLNAGKPKNYHFKKTKEAEDKGFHLIHIWDFQWANPDYQARIKSIIKGELGITAHRVYARNTYIKEPTKQEYDEFICRLSILGYRNAKHKFGLYEKGTDKLLMVMGVDWCQSGKGSVDKKNIEIVRSATELDTIVVGGTSKLLKAVNEMIKNTSEYVHCQQLVYFVDYDLHLGKSLIANGAIFDGYTGASGRNYVNRDCDIVDSRGRIKHLQAGKFIGRQPAFHKSIIEAIKRDDVIAYYNSGTKRFHFNLLEKYNDR